uniref:(northern house mosquito) hypothetical protein n=1 Tax=Culex pipiens TaxID=7175 RepID=A0A8D8B7U3_CULPI
MNHPDQIPEGLLFAHPARYRRSRQKPKPAVLEQHRVVDRKLQQQPHVTGHVFQRLVPHRIVQHLGAFLHKRRIPQQQRVQLVEFVHRLNRERLLHQVATLAAAHVRDLEQIGDLQLR